MFNLTMVREAFKNYDENVAPVYNEWKKKYKLPVTQYILMIYAAVALLIVGAWIIGESIDRIKTAKSKKKVAAEVCSSNDSSENDEDN